MDIHKGETDQFVQEQLDGLCSELQNFLSADVLAIVGRFYGKLDEDVRDAVESVSVRRGKVAVIIETTGGNVHIAERIVNCLRYHYKTVDFYVPDAAMSAGTVLVCSGDAIWMDYFSLLGPIDPQIRTAGNMFVPAIGYLHKYAELIEKSKKNKLTTAELAYLVEKFDPGEMFLYEQEKNLSISLLEKWLAQYKFRNWSKTEGRGRKVTPAMRQKRAHEIGVKLTEPKLWLSHSRGLTMDVLTKDVKLKIDDFGAEADFSKRLRQYHRLLMDYTRKRGHYSVVHTKGFHRELPW